MAHKFVIEKNKAGEYVAKFKYNSEVIFWTEGYSSKASAKNAISTQSTAEASRPTARRRSASVRMSTSLMRQLRQGRGRAPADRCFAPTG